MKSKFAMIQMESVPDPAENLKKAEMFIREAAELCAPDLVVFPETFMSEDGREVRVRNAWAQSLDGPFVAGMRKLARGQGGWDVGGRRGPGGEPEDLRV